MKGVACETRLRLGNIQIVCSKATGTTSSSQAMLYNNRHWVFISIINYQTPLLVLNYFNFMHQAKISGVKILFIPYFSPFRPPSHSPCLLVLAVTVTFLLEPPARNESSSSGLPSGNTDQFSVNCSQNPSLQLWYWQVVPGCSFFVCSYSIQKSLIYSKYATTINSRDENTTGSQAVEKSPSCCIFRLLCHFHSANKIANICAWAE